MLKKSILAAAAAALTLGLSGTAFADECSGRDHSTGTVLGALGGGLLGGFASHGNGLGIIGGAVLGGEPAGGGSGGDGAIAGAAAAAAAVSSGVGVSASSAVASCS